MAYDLDDADPEEPTGLHADPRAPEEPPRSGRLLRIASALAVMGVFAGGLWFAYTEGLRHGGGPIDQSEIPLVRADTSPFKVKPENSGGMQIPDRDMLIYGEQHPQIEHLLPPPEQPMARPEPPPGQAMNHPASPQSLGAPPGQGSNHPAPSSSTSLPGQAVSGSAPSSPSSLPEKSVGVAAPPPSPSGLQGTQPEAPSAGVTQPAVVAHAASETASPRPAGQPQPATDLIAQKIAQLEAAATANRAKRTEGGQPDVVRLQLGAVRDEHAARGAWERLKRSNADLLGSLTGGAVRADLGGKGIYYRIETGPIGDAATASRVCGELRQRHLACMVVR